MGYLHTDPSKLASAVGSGLYNNIASNHKHLIGVDFDNIPEGSGYHSAFYRNFTQKMTFESAEKRAIHVDEQPADVFEGGVLYTLIKTLLMYLSIVVY